MNIAVFSTRPYDRIFLEAANAGRHEMTFFEAPLDPKTARLAEGCDAVCVFVNDSVSEDVLTLLAACGVRLIALRCAGFNNVDLRAAARLRVHVVRVPKYSPHAVAEHAIALILALNRKVHRAFNRVREGNFSLDGLLGFDLAGKTCGIVGTGEIGLVAARILQGFGCTLLAFDIMPRSDASGLSYVSLERLFAESDIISLHCPLTPDTHHLINEDAIGRMKKGVMIINTSRGAVIDTNAVISGLKAEKIGALGLDVYEEEAHVFFEDLSGEVLQDDVLARLLTFPNVILTGHQGFFTKEALTAIAETTIESITAFEEKRALLNEVRQKA